MDQHFRNCCSLQYFHTLQIKNTRVKLTLTFQLSDLVIARNEFMCLAKWPIARISELHLEKDGHAKQTTLFIAVVQTSTYKISGIILVKQVFLVF